MRDERPETGAMKFGEDWTGVFLRGDDAIPYALALRHLLELHPTVADDDTNPVLATMVLKGLVDVLESCDERHQALDRQMLKKFDECLAAPK